MFEGVTVAGCWVRDLGNVIVRHIADKVAGVQENDW